MFGGGDSGYPNWNPARQQPAPSIDLEDRCRDSLYLVMEQLAGQIGAEGAVLSEHDGAEERPLIIFSETPFGGAASAEEALLIERGDAAGDQTRLAAGSDVRWRNATIADEAWSVMSLPIPSGERSGFRLTAYFRGGGLQVRAAAERILNPYKPLLSGFLGLWTMRSALRERLAGMASALNSAAVGVILLDRQMSILFANRMANRLLDAGKGIRRNGTSLAATQLSDAVRLHVAIEHVIAAEAGAGASCSSLPVVSLHRAANLRPIMVSILTPETDAVRRSDLGAILYLLDPHEDLAPLMKPVCALYGLSPSETRLACAIASGVSLTEAAHALKIKEQTARTYLKQIFLKTDTRRQADLVRLMLTSFVPTDNATSIEIV
jgi:DNA-binding CsgD family transcriptional regulator/PAS domain-containing protein